MAHSCTYHLILLTSPSIAPPLTHTHARTPFSALAKLCTKALIVSMQQDSEQRWPGGARNRLRVMHGRVNRSAKQAESISPRRRREYTTPAVAAAGNAAQMEFKNDRASFRRNGCQKLVRLMRCHPGLGASLYRLGL